MIVEFIGESGCGKSTLVKKVARNAKGVRRKKNLSKKETLKALGGILINQQCRRLLFALIQLKISINGFSRIFKDMYYLIGLIDLQCEFGKTKDVCILLEQGIIQFLYTVYFEKMPLNSKYAVIIQYLMEQWDYYVVYCHCEYPILKNRIEQRRDNPMEESRRIERADIKIFELHNKIFALFVDCISRECYVDIDTAKDCFSNVMDISRFIADKEK